MKRGEIQTILIGGLTLQQDCRSELNFESNLTIIEGMMAGSWSQGATHKLCELYRTVCVDGQIWKIIDQKERVVGFYNPTVCKTSDEVIQLITDLINQ